MRNLQFLQKVLYLAPVLVLLASSMILITPQRTDALSASDFKAGRIIDDPIFFDSKRMSATGIQIFLNSKVPVCDNWGVQPHAGTTRRAYSEARGVSFPLTCLKDYRLNVPFTPADQFCQAIGGGEKSAAQIIKDVGDACSINPMVLITLLQKEQSLITDDWPWPIQFQRATGFGCPDTAPCDSQYFGFFNQVYRAARQFQRYSKQPHLYNYRAAQSNLILYNPNTGCGQANIFIQNQATANLYNYTPYTPNQAALNNLGGLGDGCSSYGNLNFWRIYTQWFGPPVTSHCFYGAPGAASIEVTFRKYIHWIEQGTATLYSGTSTNCIEAHTWSIGLGSWAANVASNHPITSPANARVLYGDINGDGIDEPILVGLGPTTGSGKVEFHVWNRELSAWTNHIASNLPASSNLANAKITFADVDGNGRDEPVLILFSGTGSGKVEFHVWNNNMRSWRWQVPSNLSAFDTANGTIAFADLDGNRVDEPVLIGYRNQGSGKVEFHTWGPDWRSWRFHTASNLNSINPDNGFVTFADVDGNRVDEAVLIGLKGTGSGRIEFHTWHAGATAWRFHTATNQPTIE